MNPMHVSVFRGSQVESEHQVDALLIDENGHIVQQHGDPQRMVFPRSAVKLLQALPLIETGAAKAYELSPQLTALACASHRGEAIHTDLVQQWLAQRGLEFTALACGIQEPADESVRRALYESGRKASALHNNCSGKHAGMISTALFMGEPVQGYELYDHPVQIRLRALMGELADLDYDKLPWGVDGCGIPSYALPLQALAKSFLCYLPGAKGRTEHQWAAQELAKAIRHNPLMISGTNGLDSRLVQLAPDQVMVKTGAEGVYVAVLPKRGQILVIKARDGATRAAKAVLLHQLLQFGILNSLQMASLGKIGETIIQNWSGRVVGELQVYDPNVGMV